MIMVMMITMILQWGPCLTSSTARTSRQDKYWKYYGEKIGVLSMNDEKPTI